MPISTTLRLCAAECTMARADAVQLRQLRRSAEDVRAVLDQLDAQTPAEHCVRSTKRFSYRVKSLLIEIAQPNGGWVAYAMPTRNISRDGLCFLNSHFVYNGTSCRVTLVSLQDRRVTVAGEVVRCRYLEGTASIYEVGLRFVKPIDVSMFHRSATRSRVLVIDDDPAVGPLITCMLRSGNVDVLHTTSPKDGVETALREPFSMLLLDFEIPDCDAVEVAADLRRRGFAQPIIALTADPSDAVRGKCIHAGCNVWLAKPIDRDSLLAVVDAAREEPLVSTLLDDPAMSPIVDTFVQTLRARVEALRKAAAEGSLDALRTLVTALKGDGGSYGFAPISSAAAEVESTLSRADDVSLHSKLLALCTLCLSARSASVKADPPA